MYNSIFKNHIEQIKNEGRYRSFIQIKRIAGDFPKGLYIDSDKEITLWCINDYLGMSQNAKVIDSMISTAIEVGVGSGGTRNIGGNNYHINLLEKEIADLHKKDSSLVFTSGYVANDTTLSTLSKIFPDLVFFSDSDNHASIISGIRNSRSQKFIYNHLDVEHLEYLLSLIPVTIPKIIVFESVYSMDGFFSNIPKICELAKKYNALTFIDEVHSVGLYGNEGSGVSEMMSCMKKIDIIQGTLAKAYGCIGGYIAASSEIIEAIRLTAPGFIFTTSLPPQIAAAALTSIKHLRSSNYERQKQKEVVNKVKLALKNNGIKYLENDSHIIPVIIGDPVVAEFISKTLLSQYSIYLQHINFPTVAKKTERLRITPTPFHTDEMIDYLVKALCEVLEIAKNNFPIYDKII